MSRVLPALAAALCSAFAAAAAPDFNRDIRPILSGQCIHCHGPDEAERKGGRNGMRLDTEAGSREDHGGYAAIVPGHPERSLLLERVRHADPDEVMPPARSGKRLSEAEIRLLEAWIAAGAEYDDHWAYVPPVRPAPPPAARDLSPEDAFLRDRLAREGLSPAPEADRRTLARRVTLDLTGLPPAPEEVDAFAADPAPDAYARFVDRQLAKPAYGEHWARLWLDLARYADSMGYADDKPRTIWAYRDWVIRALNANQPFDRFTVEQIAGDLLPDPSEDQQVATAFHRNTMNNNEGGTNDEEFRSAAVVDRVNTTFAVWMGTSMACAHCHTHKYDPITQHEYFQVYALFNQSEDRDTGDDAPTLAVLPADMREEKARLEADLARAEQVLREHTAAAPSPAPRARFVRIELPGPKRILHLAEVEVLQGADNLARRGTATQSSQDFGGEPARAIDGNRDGDHQKGSVTHNKVEDDPWWEVDLGSLQPIEEIVVWNRTGGDLPARLNGYRVRLLDAERQTVWEETRAKASPREGRHHPVDPASLPASVRTAREEVTRHAERLQALKPTRVPVMRDLPAEKARRTQVHLRGNFETLGDEVQPGVPAAFHPFPPDAPRNRLGLAEWLVRRDNPLVARVTVNRFWEQIFGVGLVRTSEEFGAQGDLPEHPALLDWLAVEFMESGWDVKALLRRLVLTAAYRQSSRVSPELAARDPDNRLLARGPRLRLSAEMVRDQALAVSGLLQSRMYGPPVRPPQPNFGLSAAFGGSLDWKTSAAGDQHRRGLYTEWRRTNPYPSMVTFDAPSREVCALRRNKSNTPLQALVTLNDPVYVEAAQAFARRLIAVSPDDPERLRQGFRIALARLPTDGEVQRLRSLLTEARAEFAADPRAALALATQPLGPLPAGLSPVEGAAWTAVANVLLNLDELVMKP
jgi:mono/diheme cytochrome c family protein